MNIIPTNLNCNDEINFSLICLILRIKNPIKLVYRKCLNVDNF